MESLKGKVVLVTGGGSGILLLNLNIFAIITLFNNMQVLGE